MGFYSFYKIFKDMLRTVFGNKFLKIFFIALIILSLIAIKNKVFATSSLTFSYNNNNYTITNIPDDYNYVFIGLNRNNTFFTIYCSKQPLQFDVRGGYLGPLNISSENNYYYYSINISDINNNNYVIDDTIQRPTLYNSSTYGGVYANNSNYIYSNYDVKVNGDVVHTANDNQLQFINPTLSNTQSQLENLSFDNFIINANSFTQEMISNPDDPLVMLFYNRSLSNSQNTDGLYPIKEKYFYKESIYFDRENSTDSNYIFKYPIFKTGVYFNIGSTYEIKFAKLVYIQEYNTWGYDYFDTNYVFTISSSVTQDYINQLNQQTATSSDEEREEQLNNSINQQTQSIDNINNTITDSNVDSSSINLPTDNTNDPTQSGVDNIFQTIYNSFTSGTAQDIVFPIPNTNKNITLPATYTYNSLNNNNASWVIDIIQAFYWYIIARYIIVDIMQKIRKIKQGNLDNIENSNIKEDML